MSRNWLIGLGVGLLATAALVTVGVGAYQLGERESDRQIVVTGSETLDGRVIVDHDGWGHGGPGFLIFPLLIAGAVFLLAGRRRHRGWGYGYGCGYGPDDDRRERDPDWQSQRGRPPWEDQRGREPAPSGAPPPPPVEGDAGPPPA